MRMLRVRLVALVVPLVLAGSLACVGNTDDGPSVSGSCSFASSIPKAPASAPGYDPAVPVGETLETFAEAQGLAYLDGFVGTYLRGDAIVYTGTLEAHDNQSVLGPPPSDGQPGYKSGSIAAGPAVGLLTVQGGAGSLTVHSLATHQYVAFQQTSSASGVTSVGIILPDAEGGGNSGTCSDCVPSFLDKPMSMTATNLMSTQTINIGSGGVGPDGGVLADSSDVVTLHTYATLSLSLATPCSLTFDDIIELNAPTQKNTWVGQDDDMVTEYQGVAYAPDTGMATYYEVELYVSITDLANYGVRNFQVIANPYESSGPIGVP